MAHAGKKESQAVNRNELPSKQAPCTSTGVPPALTPWPPLGLPGACSNPPHPHILGAKLSSNSQRAGLSQAPGTSLRNFGSSATQQVD